MCFPWFSNVFMLFCTVLGGEKTWRGVFWASRNMTSLLTWFQELKAMYPEQPQLDQTLTDFISDAKAGL